MNFSFPRENRRMLLGVVVLVFLLAAGGLWFILKPRPPVEDPILIRTFENIAHISTYTQFVETAVMFSDRRMQVSGVYFHDGPNARFESLATTTLIIRSKKSSEEHRFTLHNISMGNEVYTKVETDSELLMSTIPHSPLWRHFTRDSIPQPFINIAVSGPILDNLLILSRGGSYLALAASHGTEPWGDEMLVHYTFTLSEEGQKSIGGTLGTLLGRVGESGYVDVWIDEASAEPRYMVFQGENYSSTTTISAINIPKAIEPPVL